MRNLLFSYRCSPSFGAIGEPDGESVSVYADGTVICRDYIKGRNRPVKQCTVANLPELAAQIESILIRHHSTVKAIPEYLNNGTCDGCVDSFQYGDKAITAITIRRCNENDLKMRNPQYYDDYKGNISFENQVLDILAEITTAFEKCNVRLDLLFSDRFSD